MQKQKGTFIAIEGGDGSGKGTQAKILEEHFLSEGREVFRISFPQYGHPSASIVEMYLNGAFGSAGQHPPELTSLAYAIDRFAAADDIRKKLARGMTVIADRYVASNLAHQAAVIPTPEKRKAFYELLKQIEFEVLGIPRPDINIVLVVPTELAQANIDKKANRSYTDKKRDIHEADANHLELAKRNYLELCKLYPNEFRAIDCVKNGRLKTIAQVTNDILALLSK